MGFKTHPVTEAYSNMLLVVFFCMCASKSSSCNISDLTSMRQLLHIFSWDATFASHLDQSGFHQARI